MSEDCIFCKIANGEIATELVYQTPNTVVFKDANPNAPVHLLVVPKKHYATLNDVDDKELLGELMQTIQQVTKKIGLKSYKVHINTGKDAGQVVFHLHIHILGNK